MEKEQLLLMEAFITRAKRATYVGGGKKLLPYRLGSHDLQYSEGDWAYHDSYLGDSDFIGQEVVYYRMQIVWGMNYLGRILRADQITPAQAGEMIKHSLTLMYEQERFLGGWEHTLDDLRYTDSNTGDVSFFTGRESISRRDEVVYELVYHGGLVI